MCALRYRAWIPQIKAAAVTTLGGGQWRQELNRNEIDRQGTSHQAGISNMKIACRNHKYRQPNRN